MHRDETTANTLVSLLISPPIAFTFATNLRNRASVAVIHSVFESKSIGGRAPPSFPTAWLYRARTVPNPRSSSAHLGRGLFVFFTLNLPLSTSVVVGFPFCILVSKQKRTSDDGWVGRARRPRVRCIFILSLFVHIEL